MYPESIAVAAGRPPRQTHAPLNTPIVLSSTFHGGAEGNDYLRQATSETIRALEEAIGALEGGTALTFSSGMASIAAVVEGLPVGAKVVVPQAGYWTMTAMFAQAHMAGRLDVHPVDITDTAAVVAALPGSTLLWLETVTNPMIGVVDLPPLIEAAHAVGALVGVDATFSTPLIVRPLDLGADIVMHSVTKYFAGHADLLMGVLIARDGQRADELAARRMMTGAIPGALEAYLALRGLRTLPLRLERAQANALELAQRLATHTAVTLVRYPGLVGDAGHDLATRLHAGFGAMMSFDIAGTAEDADAVCDRVQLITHATSLGGVESLIERRGRYAGEAANGTPPTLLRFSVGIEHVEDLWADLDQALRG
jgi:cystathionine gamma-synthase